MENPTFIEKLTNLSKKMAVIVAIVSSLTTLCGAAWSLLEFARATRERANVARIAQLTTYQSFGDLLKRYHNIEKMTDDFMRRYRKNPPDLVALMHQYQTGSSIYYAEEMKEFREIHQFYEELGTLIRFKAIDFELVYQTVIFPSDFYEDTQPLQVLISEHWFELRKDAKNRALNDFGFNLSELRRNYEARRAGKPIVWAQP